MTMTTNIDGAVITSEAIGTIKVFFNKKTMLKKH